MKRLLLLLLFLVLVSSPIFAEEFVSEKDSSGFYLLTLGGVNLHNSFTSDNNLDYASFNFGGLLGYQFAKYFAMEFGYSFNDLYSKGGTFDFVTIYDSSIYAHDIKLNFLLQRYFNLNEDMRLAPYFGVGLGVSSVNVTLSILNETASRSETFFNAIIKAGLRYNYKYFLVGLGFEVDLRIATSEAVERNFNTFALNFEAGVKF